MNWLLGQALKSQQCLTESQSNTILDGVNGKKAMDNIFWWFSSDLWFFLFSVESDDFKSKVADLAKALGITCHPNHMDTFEACCIFIQSAVNSKRSHKVRKIQIWKEDTRKFVNIRRIKKTKTIRRTNQWKLETKLSEILLYIDHGNRVISTFYGPAEWTT